MRTILALLLISGFTACSKNRDTTPKTLEGSYKGQQQYITNTYIYYYPANMEISLNEATWNAKTTNRSGTTFLLSGNYTIEKDSAKFVNHTADQEAPAFLNTNYKITVRGDSLYLERVINDNGEIYSLKRN